MRASNSSFAADDPENLCAHSNKGQGNTQDEFRDEQPPGSASDDGSTAPNPDAEQRDL
jgi:hypothetical protein